MPWIVQLALAIYDNMMYKESVLYKLFFMRILYDSKNCKESFLVRPFS